MRLQQPWLLRIPGETDKIKRKVSLHQGSELSPMLFIIIMDVVSEDPAEDSPWSMLFADDLVLCDEERDNLEERLEDGRRRLEEVGLEVSRAKTEHLSPTKNIGDIMLKNMIVRSTQICQNALHSST